MPDPMRSYLDFEKPVAELESKIDELRALAASGSDIGDEVARIEDKAAQALTELYSNLTPWQKTLVARHPQRPHFTDFIGGLITEFTPMAGDRKFADDEALVGGFGRFRGESICVVGQEKGATTESRIKHNFGMAGPVRSTAPAPPRSAGLSILPMSVPPARLRPVHPRPSRHLVPHRRVRPLLLLQPLIAQHSLGSTRPSLRATIS